MIIQHHFMWGNNHGSECSYTLFYWFRVQSYREDVKNKTTLCRFEALRLAAILPITACQIE